MMEFMFLDLTATTCFISPGYKDFFFFKFMKGDLVLPRLEAL